MGIIIPFHLMIILSMIDIASLNDQYGCSSLCSSTLVDGQLQSLEVLIIFQDNYHYFSSAMQSGMPIHDSTVLIVMFMPGISLSQFILLLCLNMPSASLSMVL